MNNSELISLNFKKYLLKRRILNYLFKDKLITEDTYEKSIVQIKKLHNIK